MDEQARELRRRDLIKKAAVAGGIVWASPVIESMASAASAAGTPRPTTSTTEEPPTTTSTSTTSTTSTTTTTPPPELEGCFKYMYNWCSAQEVQTCVDSGAISSQFNQNNPAPECQQSLAENAPGQVQTNPNCCQQNDESGNNLQWNEVPDFSAACVTVTGAICACPGSPDSVTFTVTCPDCYFADVTVVHGSREGLDSGDCGDFSLSTSNTGGNPFTRSWTINFPPDRAPVWFKFWVGCGLSVCSPQIVPCTQSDCLPGGQPAPNRVLNI